MAERVDHTTAPPVRDPHAPGYVLTGRVQLAVAMP